MFSRFSVGAALCAAVVLTATAAAPAHAQGNPTAGAKGLITNLSKTRTLGQFAQNMTNESAGKIGVLMGVGLQVSASMADAMKSGPNGQPLTPQQRKLMQMSKGVARELTPILARYGVKGQNPMATMMTLMGGGAMGSGGAPKMTLPPQVTRQGRKLLTELAIPLEKMSAASGQPSAAANLGARANMKPDAMRYKVLGPTRVAMTDPKNAAMPPMEARFEDGKWRAHIMVDQMIQQRMQQRRAGGGGGGMGAPAKVMP